MKKAINKEVNRPIQQFEVDYLIQILCHPKQTKVLKIYETQKSNWNLFLLQWSDNSQAFVSIPKIKDKCSPSIYGSIEHAEQYNIFIDLKA
jgi:hypothetical protein